MVWDFVVIVSKKQQIRLLNTETIMYSSLNYCFNDTISQLMSKDMYIRSGRVKEIYFTGMFTSNHSGFAVHYYVPESGKLWKYYPDFLLRWTMGHIKSLKLIRII